MSTRDFSSNYLPIANTVFTNHYYKYYYTKIAIELFNPIRRNTNDQFYEHLIIFQKLVALVLILLCLCQ